MTSLSQVKRVSFICLFCLCEDGSFVNRMNCVVWFRNRVGNALDVHPPMCPYAVMKIFNLTSIYCSDTKLLFSYFYKFDVLLL